MFHLFIILFCSFILFLDVFSLRFNITTDRERNRLRAGTGVAIVKGDTIPIITMTALPPDQGVCLFSLCRCHAVEEAARFAL